MLSACVYIPHKTSRNRKHAHRVGRRVILMILIRQQRFVRCLLIHPTSSLFSFSFFLCSYLFYPHFSLLASLFARSLWHHLPFFRRSRRAKLNYASTYIFIYTYAGVCKSTVSLYIFSREISLQRETLARFYLLMAQTSKRMLPFLLMVIAQSVPLPSCSLYQTG